MFYVMGDADGPLCDEVRIGYTKRGAYRGFKEKFALYRSRKIIAHVEMCLAGEAAVRRLRAALHLRLIEDWRKISDRWWNIAGLSVRALVDEIVEAEGLKILSRKEAEAILQERFNRIMDKVAGI